MAAVGGIKKVRVIIRGENSKSKRSLTLWFVYRLQASSVIPI